MKEIVELSQDPRVCLVQAHQCWFGQTTSGPGGGCGDLHVKTPSGFLTNTWCIGEELNKQCEGGHAHGWRIGGRATSAAIYPDALCEAICKGSMKQKAQDRLYGIQGIYLCGKNKSYVINDLGDFEDVNLLEHIVGDHVGLEE